MADTKWYSNGLTSQEVKSLQKDYCLVTQALEYVADGVGPGVTLFFRTERGKTATHRLHLHEDIRNLLVHTKVRCPEELENHVIEVYHDGHWINGISVNPNLVLERK